MLSLLQEQRKTLTEDDRKELVDTLKLLDGLKRKLEQILKKHS